jgi:hypothetical protein
MGNIEREKQKNFISFLTILYFKLIETSFFFDKKDYQCENHLPKNCGLFQRLEAQFSN